MKRKRILAACLAALMLLLFSSCASGGSGSLLSPQNPAVVTLWHYYVGENQQALDAAVSSFNQTEGMQRGVVVETVAMGSIADLEENITSSAAGVINSLPMPHIFSSYPDKAMEIDALGIVVDLNEYFTSDEKDLYVSDFLADGTFDGGRLLTLPIVKSTELLYVNASAWREFAAASSHTGASLASWEGIYEASRAYYQWSDAQTPDTLWDGKTFMGFDSVANYIIVACKQLGVNVIDADGGDAGQATLDTNVLRRVFEIYYKGISLGYFGAQGKFRSDDIKAGALAAYVGSSSGAAYFPTWIENNNAQQPIDFMPLSYPVFSGGEAYAIQQGAGMCVAKSTPAQEEASVLFLKWFTSAQQNIDFAMTTGYLPVTQAAYTMQEFSDALQTLQNGDKSQQVIAGVYEIALQQIIGSNTYAAKPFSGSYGVRSTLQSALVAAGEQGKAQADVLKSQGLDEDDILQALDVDSAFEAWIQNVRDELDRQGINWV